MSDRGLQIYTSIRKLVVIIVEIVTINYVKLEFRIANIHWKLKFLYVIFYFGIVLGPVLMV